MEKCHSECYSTLPKHCFNEIFRIYGGIARTIFSSSQRGVYLKPNLSKEEQTNLSDEEQPILSNEEQTHLSDEELPILSNEELTILSEEELPILSNEELTILSDEDQTKLISQKIDAYVNTGDALEALQKVNFESVNYETSHKLLHIVVNDQYQMKHLEICSKYVTQLLLKKSHLQLIQFLKKNIHFSPQYISCRMFEYFGHEVFSHGGETLKCRKLSDTNDK